MNNIEIITHLNTIMNDEQKRELSGSTKRISDKFVNDRAVLVHGIIECYSRMGETTDEQVMEVRKGLKVLVSKYMNGGRDIDGERNVCRAFMLGLWKDWMKIIDNIESIDKTY